MLRFSIYPSDKSAYPIDLASAYVVGSDGVPLRAEIERRQNTELVCAKRADGPAGLATLWPIPGYGALLLETSRLMDREKPYNLSLELARGRLTRINLKREDWGLFDFEGVEPVNTEIAKARDLFISALKAGHPGKQAQIAEAALKAAVLASEQLSLFHAEIFLNRRKQTHAFSRRTIGCVVNLADHSDKYRQCFQDAFDFAYVPIPWRLVEPKHQDFNWDAVDSWVGWLAKNHIPIKMGPLVRFHQEHIPDWLSIYEADFESVRNLLFDHVRRIVERYGSHVHHWDVVNGIHAENTFGFSFEQLMEVTRTAVALVKKQAPRAQAVINLVMPWGEYYARNQRTIPPMLYADMVVQSGVAFDGLGAKFVFGSATDGMFVRDMFQISEKLDRLGNFGKPVHVSAAQVPSARVDGASGTHGGCWRKSWDEAVQDQWIKEFYGIALSKPFVESIAWADLADRATNKLIPHGGLLRADLEPKPSYKTIKQVRTSLLKTVRKPPTPRQE